MYFFFVISLIISFLLYIIGGPKLISDLVAVIYPAYQSFKAIDSKDRGDDVQWLMYWVVFSLVSLFETIGMWLLDMIPFYFFIKVCFFVWLYHPKFLGAELVYIGLVRPHLMPYLKSISITKTAIGKKIE